jgi:hypothetical protein
MKNGYKLIYMLFSACLLMPKFSYGFNQETQSLSEVMFALSTETEQVRQSLLEENHVVLKVAAKNIIQYSKVPTNVMVNLVEQLGQDVLRYKAFETLMYYQAKSLLQAVEQKDAEQVLLQYHKLLQQCHDCHAAFQ